MNELDKRSGSLPQSSNHIPIATSDWDRKAPSGCPAEIKQRANNIAEILDLPADISGEPLSHYFCRLHNLHPPRRSRAVFDLLIRDGRARNFPSAVALVTAWLRDWPGVEIDLSLASADSVDSAEN